MHFVAALDSVPEMRAILALFEGVATGAADGYGRMAARPLRGRGDTAILLGGRALREPGLVAATRIAAATGAKLLAEVFPTRIERGAGLPPIERVAYLAELASVQLAGLRHLILVDAK